jgi:hypothetical protein
MWWKPGSDQGNNLLLGLQQCMAARLLGAFSVNIAVCCGHAPGNVGQHGHAAHLCWRGTHWQQHWAQAPELACSGVAGWSTKPVCFIPGSAKLVSGQHCSPKLVCMTTVGRRSWP